MDAVYSRVSQAINVGSVTTFIDAGSQDVAKEIENGSAQARLVTISISRISSPEEGGQEIPMEVAGELMLSPSRLMLPAHAKNNVRFFYKGPQDGKERYYRIRWLDTALSMDDQSNNRRQAVATTSAQIGTILVVTPRQQHFAYNLQNGMLSNQGMPLTAPWPTAPVWTARHRRSVKRPTTTCPASSAASRKSICRIRKVILASGWVRNSSSSNNPFVLVLPSPPGRVAVLFCRNLKPWCVIC